MKKYILTVKDTGPRAPTGVVTELYTGTELECLSRFHKLCGFSFADHKKYSYLEYSITEKPPRAKKYEYLFVLQGHYGQGWEDLTASEERQEVRQNLKEYRDNEGGAYRIIRRREPVTA